MAVETLADGIITVNTETADALGIDISVFQGLGSEVVETTTAKEFE
jgi:putative ABC transport system substrate-binding protein